jgi:hypothetical protein
LDNSDDWGRDPSVRIMRRVFGRMETAQKGLLERLNISPFDGRLRRWRERTRELFEEGWAEAARSGVVVDEEKACDIYIRALSEVMNADGINVSEELFP